MELAAKLGAAGAQGGMTTIDFDWARRTRRMKEELGLYVEIQTFLPRAGEDISVFERFRLQAEVRRYFMNPLRTVTFALSSSFTGSSSASNLRSSGVSPACTSGCSSCF